MEYFQVSYYSRVVIYERKLLIRLVTGNTYRINRDNIAKEYQTISTKLALTLA